ncbi:hypothetical protein SERLA73DRAFT_79932 [Serpula lacrymans var. lacrymans S7.3]|uniref:Uncharacterized protein n=2 Tax=Serpula lacrymans var. lacrymans TaxID=341189 RepID=F8QI42_SERL3|nr:uncharacterized protein SERLADRAFT_435771 [Serpula lacrymans var. lacrymans S7.9]EGN92053.1 hypothetical protein SERLA73DRAFT_79932 [Serpula lacrymans var. lacrymans S7.3]EGO27998.1 hypothetical protein SERLADRAFT_435771 [Serpula lacrymans var. lacrymans S7.9]
MTSTIAFPHKPSPASSIGPASGRNFASLNDISVDRPTPAHSIDMSVVSRHATALEVCDFVYGNSHEPSFLDAAELFYEANAIDLCSPFSHVLVYENPFITATSRSIISDIYALSRQFSTVDVPRPLAMLYTLLRLRLPNMDNVSGDGVWFHAIKVWNEVGEVSESESFDGQRKSIVEHTLNILFLPGIHNGSCQAQNPNHILGPATSSTCSSPTLSASSAPHSPLTPRSLVAHPSSSYSSLSLSSTSTSFPSLPIPYTALSIPSPFHLRLPIHTRLSFNESGLITYHRDIWDVKDVIGLVPGVSLVQWVTARLVARGVARIGRLLLGGRVGGERTRKGEQREWILGGDKAALEENHRDLLTGPGITKRRSEGSMGRGDEEQQKKLGILLPSETYRVHAQRAHEMEQHMREREKRACEQENQTSRESHGRETHHPFGEDQQGEGPSTKPKRESKAQKATVSTERMGTEEV